MLLAALKKVSHYQRHSTDPKYLYSFAVVCYRLSPGVDFNASVSAGFLLPDVFPVPHCTFIDTWDHQSDDDDLNISRRFSSISVFQDGR